MGQKINQKQYGKKYSTTEQLTGDVWIDGKPIYRKVVECGSLPNNAQKSVAHGITGLDALINLYGYSHNGTSKFLLTTNRPNFPANGVGVYVDGGNIVLETAANRTAWTAIAVLEYTKT